MKIGTENGRIFLETKEYDSFYMKPMPCHRHMTLGGAVRLRKELDEAIHALQPTVSANGADAAECSDLTCSRQPNDDCFGCSSYTPRT